MFLILFLLTAVFFSCDDSGKSTDDKDKTESQIITITFEFNNGSEVEAQSIEKGKTVKEPDNPLREGYLFAGWHSDIELNEIWNFNTPVDSDLILYARWTEVIPVIFAVTFESNDGSFVSSQTVSNGGNAVRPANPIKSGFTFENWYSDRLLTTAYDFSDAITSNITIYAKWSLDTNYDYTISLTYNGPDVNPKVVYVSWIEDESENVLQNIYVCERLVPDISGKSRILGVALPFWKEYKYDVNMVDGVTGASVQVSKTVARTLDIGSVRRFRVYFEIDRSSNGNTYFNDRPSFIYQSIIIDLDNLNTEYQLYLYGYMGNATQSGTYGQHVKPGQSVPGYAPYKLMNSLTYIELLNDMVTEVKVIVEQNYNPVSIYL